MTSSHRLSALDLELARLLARALLKDYLPSTKPEQPAGARLDSDRPPPSRSGVPTSFEGDAR